MKNRLGELGLAAMAAAVIVLMCLVALQVLFSALDVNPVRTFPAEVPLLGKAITLNSLLDLQWHLLVIAGLLPAGLVWLRDQHVRVDFFYQTRGARWQARLNLVGNLIFAAPFFALILPASWDFMVRAWTSDEGSRNGGINDLWLIKAVLPLGLGLLALAVLVETIRLCRTAR